MMLSYTHKVKGQRLMRLSIEKSFSLSCLRDAERCFKNKNNRDLTYVLFNVRWQKLETTSCTSFASVLDGAGSRSEFQSYHPLKKATDFFK